MTTIILMKGALAALCLVASVVFLRYRIQTGDRFFSWFAAAFATFAANWIVVVYDTELSHLPHIHLIRLAGFVQIAIAVLVKNQAASEEPT